MDDQSRLELYITIWYISPESLQINRKTAEGRSSHEGKEAARRGR